MIPMTWAKIWVRSKLSNESKFNVNVATWKPSSLTCSVYLFALQTIQATN